MGGVDACVYPGDDGRWYLQVFRPDGTSWTKAFSFDKEVLKPMTESDLINGLLAQWMDLAPERAIPNHCILGTRVAIEVGSYFGFRWEPLAVDIAVFNEAGLDQFLKHIPVQDWPPEAHSVGCVCEDKLGETGWSGHVIVRAEGQIFDMAGAMFHRPAKSVQVDRPWAMPRPDNEGPWLLQQDGVAMALWPRPSITIYRQTPDWKKGYKPVAAELIRMLKTTETERT